MHPHEKETFPEGTEFPSHEHGRYTAPIPIIARSGTHCLANSAVPHTEALKLHRPREDVRRNYGYGSRFLDHDHVRPLPRCEGSPVVQASHSSGMRTRHCHRIRQGCDARLRPSPRGIEDARRMVIRDQNVHEAETGKLGRARIARE